MNVDGLTPKGRPWDFSHTFPRDMWMDFATYVLTPGIPAEYAQFIFKFDKRPLLVWWSHKIVDDMRHEAEPRAMENALSITLDDGWTMLRHARFCRRRPYVGVIPHWSSLALQHRAQEQTTEELAAELGVSRQSIWRWRKSSFHPLNLQRRATVNMRRQYQTQLS